MKKNLLFALVILLCLNLDAQYKKASFLSRPGRTHEIGFFGHFISDNGLTVPGIAYSYGRERAGKKIFHWFDMEFLLPTKFSYNTREFTTKEPIRVSGKSNLGFLYRYNFAYYLADNSNRETKVLPFVTAGLHFILFGGELRPDRTTFSPATSTDVEKQPIYDNLNMGASIGLGGIYKLSAAVGIKATARYSYEYNSDSGTTNDWKSQGYSVYKFYGSHPYVSVGIRFIVDKD